MAAPRKENIKEIILTSTEQLLGEKTLSDISLADIARRAGISKGTLYYHYKTKDEIIFDITDKYLKEQWQNLISWTEDENKDTSIHRMIKYIMERNVASASMRMQLYYDVMQGDEVIRKKLIERYRDFHMLISSKIEQRMHNMVAPEYLTWLVLLASDGLIIQQLIGGNIDTSEFIRQTSIYIKLLDDYLKDRPAFE